MKKFKKMYLALIVVCAFLVAFLFIIRIEVPKCEPIASIDTSIQDATLSTNFIWPARYTGFALVFKDNKGETKEYCSNPDWPLILEVEIFDRLNKQQIIKATLDKTEMIFASWHNPSTSLLFFRRLDRKMFVSGREYQLRLKVLQPNTEVGKCAIFIH